MKKSERRVLVLAVVIIAIVGVQMMFAAVTARRRDARLAQIKRPDSMIAYEQLAAEMPGRETAGSARQPERKMPVFPKNAADTIVAYEGLHQQVLDEWGGDVCPPGYEEALNRNSDKLTEGELAAIFEAVREREKLIQQIRELAAQGGPVYPLDFSLGMHIELSHLAEMRAFARLLALDAILHADEGDYAGAVDDIIAGMQLGDALAGEPVIISQLVRFAVYGIMTENIQQCFHGDDLSAEQMSRLQAQLDQADNRHASAESFIGEQMMITQTFSEFRAGEHTDILTRKSFLFDDGTTLGQLTKPIRPLLVRSYVPVMAPRLNMLESAVMDLMGRAAVAAELPYYQARPELMRIDREVVTLSSGHVIANEFVPAMTGVCRAQARHEARIDLVQMGLVLEQYQADHGSYPDTLDAIAPRMEWSMPVDPFTGEPYHYRPTGDSFRLYSVGFNLTDEGGRHDYNQGDILWRGER
jgi:hypothetical protein